MSKPIRAEVVSAYPHCPRRAFLLHSTEDRGAPTEYGLLLEERARTNRTSYLGTLEQTNISMCPYNDRGMSSGGDVLTDANLEAANVGAYCDLLRASVFQRENSLLYEPTIVVGTYRVTKEQMLKLAVAGYVLGQIQGKSPSIGYLVTLDGGCHRINLQPMSETVSSILEQIRAWSDEPATQPPVILNKHCPYCPFKNACREQAEAIDDLSLLDRMTPKAIRQYHNKGIFTVNQLSYTFHPRRQSKRAKARGRPHNFSLQAMAIRDQKVYVLDLPVFPLADTQVFIDMEGEPDGSFVYLIGVLVVRDGQETYQSFWADTLKDEAAILKQLDRALSGLANPRLFHYGSYESRVLKRAASRSVAQTKLTEIANTRLTNVLSQIYSRIYFPTCSNSLKDVAGYLGHAWRTPGATGLDAMVWRSRWESTRDDTLKERLIEYNLDDCRALKHLTSFLLEIGDAASGTCGPATRPNLIRVETLDDELLRSNDEWGKKEFAISEFAVITKCAYFDYQRAKVFLRTNPALRQIRRRQRKSERRPSYRITKTVEFRARKCPYCESAHFCQDGKRFRSKVSLDLRISQAGIARRVTRCLSKVYRCSQCRRSFVPQAYAAQERFGHSLAAWAVHQHIANRITFENLQTTVRECFNLPLDFRKLHEFKARFALYYDKTYRHILKKLVSGPLLHADETKANLQKESCYVWVFTNMEEVAFVLRPDRNAAFLHELLRGFRGVLVSDFFSGYDSLECPQQKCLVHLMRDLNDGLLADPIDNDLKELGQRFGHVLHAIISTVDRFGLKARYLKRHKPQVSQFLAAIEPLASDSEVVRKLKKRMTKYGGELFTFLDYDGVPWNNNNAEHAVKHFAKYRRLANGRFTENGLRDYLKLLSIYETCKYKAVSFLEFLLSKERDIDSYAQRS